MTDGSVGVDVVQAEGSRIVADDQAAPRRLCVRPRLDGSPLAELQSHALVVGEVRLRGATAERHVPLAHPGIAGKLADLDPEHPKDADQNGPGRGRNAE